MACALILWRAAVLRSGAPAGARHRLGLLDKHEVCAVVGVTFPSIWSWMIAGKFPRSKVVYGKSKWMAADIADWLDGLPQRPLKGDEATNNKTVPT